MFDDIVWDIDLVRDLSHVVYWFDELVESHDQVCLFQVESLNETSIVQPTGVAQGSVPVGPESPFRGVRLLTLEALFSGSRGCYDVFDRVGSFLDVVLSLSLLFGGAFPRFPGLARFPDFATPRGDDITVTCAIDISNAGRRGVYWLAGVVVLYGRGMDVLRNVMLHGRGDRPDTVVMMMRNIIIIGGGGGVCIIVERVVS